MKKKTLTVAIALVLVVALAVGATWAYLKASSGPVTNTFTVGKVLDDDTKFELKEHESTYDSETGKYTIAESASEVDSNTYSSVAPKMVVAKDPFVRISTKVTTPAYLYVEVVDATVGDALSYTLDSSWKQLKNDDGTAVKGLNGGDVYYYVTDDAANGKVVTGDYSTTPLKVDILKDNQVVIGNSVESFAQDANTLTFYGYLYQAVGFETPLAAYQTVNSAQAGE